MDNWISIFKEKPKVIDVRIKLIDGSELVTWAQSDGDFWSEILQIFITPDKVTHWIALPQESFKI